MSEGPTYQDFIIMHEKAKSKILKKEGATEEIIAAVDEEVAKDERKKKVIGVL